MSGRSSALFVASVLMLIISFVSPLHAQNPTDVVGPYLIEPLSQPRKWIGAASASLYSASLGRTDYFAFAGGDTGSNSKTCTDWLTNTIDVYVANMGINPKLKCKGLIGCATLSVARSYVSAVGVTFPPSPIPVTRRVGYLIFAGGLQCDENNNRKASAVVDIVSLDTLQLIASVANLPSGPRNYIASSSLCKWDKVAKSYLCIAFFAGGQLGGNTYTTAIDVLDLNANPPAWKSPQTMTVARAFLASASFTDSMLFAGGKSESGLAPSSIVTAYNQVDYFFDGQIMGVQQNLSKPRFDLSGAGVTVRIADSDYYYAIFVGGTDQNRNVCNDIDVWSVQGDTPKATTASLITGRTAPTVAVLARYSQQPIVVVTGGDSSIAAGCQPAGSAEFMPIDANSDTQKVASTTPMSVNGASVAACDTATASNEFYILQAGGVLASGSSTANVVAFCWGSCPQLPAPPPGNVAPDSSSADLSPGSKAALAIFFITYFANIGGVVFYCREKAVNMPIPLFSAFVGWILCWVYILFVLPARNAQKLQDRANLQNRML